MLYGFGDDQQPYTETIDLLEDLCVEYITETVRTKQSTHCEFAFSLVYFWSCSCPLMRTQL